MKCRDVAPLIYLIKEGELTEEEKQKLDSHLATCNACTKKYESARLMDGLITKAKPVLMRKLSINVTDSEIYAALEKSMNPRGSVTRSMRPTTFLKGMAATFLVVIASTLVFQEAAFYRYQSSINVQLYRAAVPATGDMETTDCLARLKKVYRMGSLSSFARADQVAINTISEDQLRNIIDQVCGSNKADISTVKKLMIQSGLLKMTKNKE